MELSERLQLKRKELGYTQEEIAEKINVSRQTISNWETGRTLPDINSLIMISDVYDISLDELIKGDNQMIKKLSKDSKEAERWFVFTSYLVIGLSLILTYQGNNLSHKLLALVCVMDAVVLVYFIMSGKSFLTEHRSSVKENLKNSPDKRDNEISSETKIISGMDVLFWTTIACGVINILVSIIWMY